MTSMASSAGDGPNRTDGQRSRIVFVSYPHDSPSHEEAVLELADVLRGQGVDVVLDKLAGQRRRHWPEWARHNIDRADYVLAVASPEYKRAADGKSAANERRGVREETLHLQERLNEDRETWYVRSWRLHRGGWLVALRAGSRRHVGPCRCPCDGRYASPGDDRLEQRRRARVERTDWRARGSLEFAGGHHIDRRERRRGRVGDHRRRLDRQRALPRRPPTTSSGLALTRHALSRA
jgi:sugar/nucleoside kinase (ribokinase family)